MLHPRGSLLLAVILATLAVVAQQHPRAAQQKAEAELLALHQGDRRAHFKHDINALLAHVGSQLVDVRDGKVAVMSREDIRAKFADYFSHAEFSAWDDVQPPVVRASDDGMMGWMIVRVRIAYTEKDRSGIKSKHDSTAAWMSAYEKRNGNWVMTGVTSTFEEH